MNILDAPIKKARKPHQCCGCNIAIAKGEYYEDVRIAGEGHVYTWKTCAVCAWVIQNVSPDIWASDPWDRTIDEGSLSSERLLDESGFKVPANVDFQEWLKGQRAEGAERKLKAAQAEVSE